VVSINTESEHTPEQHEQETQADSASPAQSSPNAWIEETTKEQNEEQSEHKTRLQPPPQPQLQTPSQPRSPTEGLGESTTPEATNEESHENENHQGERARFGKKKSLFLLVSFLLLFGVFYSIGFGEMFHHIGELDPWLIAALVLLTALVLVIDAFRWKIIIDGLHKSSYRSLFPIFLSGTFVNTITPGLNNGGEVVRAYYLSKLTGKTKAECLATIIMDAATIATAFMVLFLFSLVYMVFFLNITTNVVLLITAIFGILFTLGFLYYRHKKSHSPESSKARFSGFLKKIYGIKLLKAFFARQERCDSFERFENFIFERLQNFKETLLNLARNKTLFIKAFLLSFVPMLIMIFRSYILFHALGEDVEFLTVLAVLSFAYFLGYFIPLPGGLGVIEATMIELYIINDIDPKIAGAVTLLDRSFYLLFSMGGGYASLNYLGYKYSLKKESAGGEEGNEPGDDGATKP